MISHSKVGGAVIFLQKRHQVELERAWNVYAGLCYSSWRELAVCERRGGWPGSWQRLKTLQVPLCAQSPARVCGSMRFRHYAEIAAGDLAARGRLVHSDRSARSTQVNTSWQWSEWSGCFLFFFPGALLTPLEVEEVGEIEWGWGFQHTEKWLIVEL